MQYVGSKGKVSKELVPFIQNFITDDCKGYIEPFVGGANIIDKIKCDNKIGYDINPYLIALLNHVKVTTDDIPEEITREHYYDVKNNQSNYDEWYIGLIGFCGSFRAKFWGGYGCKGNKSKNKFSPYHYAKNSITRQAENLMDITFICKDYSDLVNLSGYVIYCDPPYKGVTGYNFNFNYDDFYEWVRKMATNNVILVSEYEMPADFECIWEKSYTSLLSLNNPQIKNEKLFMYKNGIKSL